MSCIAEEPDAEPESIISMRVGNYSLIMKKLRARKTSGIDHI